MRRFASLRPVACFLAGVLPLPAAAQPTVIRAEDQRVADVATRLATRGVARCQATVPNLGFLLQYLGQYTLPDRPTAAVQYGLQRGPGVLAVVPDGPAARAALQPGDVVIAIDGVPLPAEPMLDQVFDQQRARAHADGIADLLDAAALDGSVELTVLRAATEVPLRVVPTPACPSRVHLARSNQLNAFADGRHVFLTTRLLAEAKTDDELAFVIAHEMAHNVLGHPAQIRAMKAETKGLDGLLTRPAHTRRTEREADRLAAELMLDAGYSIDGAGRLLGALDSGWSGPTLFANHDSVGDRVKSMRAQAAARAIPKP